ncbi:Superoxide dismutase [Mn] 2, mitochondrial [Smittium mucronatum]|uniref:Superoxide dismutase n=1 Tax=Smittium mucronatum TaxID=133383 RepID=A0A1R0H839_9FUNG|nr:Superoxide dismutase [Mn] 2, mitochondrial [Smittium mucronatum]
MNTLSSTALRFARSSRGIVVPARSKHTLPKLDYAYGDLAPVWSEEIVRNHYTGNHNGYVNNLNAAEAAITAAISANELDKTAELYKAIRFNAGGHINHSFLWKIVTPLGKNSSSDSSTATSLGPGSLSNEITRSFGSLDGLISKMNAKTAAIQGSGWGWLVVSKTTGNLEIITTPNQDNPIYYGYNALFGIDAWEHAFYLDYKTAKAEYFKQIWRIANWKQIETNFENAMSTIKK